MNEQRFNEVTAIVKGWGKRLLGPLTGPIPHKVFRDMSDDGICHLCDEDWQGKVSRFMRETKLGVQELREWGQWEESRQIQEIEDAEREE